MGTPKCYKFRGLNEVKNGNEAMNALKASASGKAKARYPDPPQEPGQSLSDGMTGGGGGPKHKGSYGSGTPDA